ncbi:MAG TPA: hypothetical protein VJM33_07605 [Microthrixaceae bacterium]|nr:hypothetical protein [Microthrixaceae bacterium]
MSAPVESPESEAANGSRRGDETRVALVAAGWRVLDRMTFAEMLSGISARRVAAKAGRTPGAFHHHFESHEAFVDAMLDELAATPPDPGPSLMPPHRSGVDDADVLAAVRAGSLSVIEDWERQFGRHHRRLLLVNSRAGVDPSAAEALCAELDRSVAAIRGGSEWVQAALGREPVAPLDSTDIVHLASAGNSVLMLRRAVDPDRVDAELMATVWTTQIVAFTRPRGSATSVAEVATRVRPKRRSAGRRREPKVADPTARLDGVGATIELFRQGWDHRSFVDVSNATGLDPDELSERYGSMRQLVAASFVAGEDDFHAAARRHRDRDPHRALADVLCEIARWASTYPHVALALLDERLDRCARASRLDIHAAVPLDAIVLEALEAVESAAPIESAEAPIESAEAPTETVGGVAPSVATSSVASTETRRRDLVGAACDLTLGVAATRSQMSPAAVASRAVGVLLGFGGVP